jgi:hypothetical protein
LSILAKRVLLAALTVVGLVLLVLGAWFTAHLGSSGSATFRATPAPGSVVLLEPSVLNRVNRPVTVTATARNGGRVFLGVASPSDARAIVGGADRTMVTSAQVEDWSLVSTRAGAGVAPALAGADIWRKVREGSGTVRLTLDQQNAPETLVIATPDGRAADLSAVTVMIARRTWLFQALLTTLVGLLAAAAGAAGLWHERSGAAGRAARTQAARQTREEVAPS